MISLAQTLSGARTDLPTSLGTSDLRKLGADILRQSIFSARMSNATAVQAVREAIQRILVSVDGKSSDNLAEARLKLKYIGRALGYDPAKGFPGETGVEPAEAGSLRDLYSTDRINLVLKTQETMCQGAAKNIWGNEPDALEQYPAWELVRVGAVEVPRGEKRTKHGIVEVPEDAWDSDNGRWVAAGRESGDEDALRIFKATGRMVARKDSPVWQALSAGAGGYTDNVDNAGAEPYAFNSLMGRVELSAQEFSELGGDASGIEQSATDFGSDEVKVKKARFDADFWAELKKEFQTGESKFKVKLEVVP
jgi:hypothetical protein